MQEGIVGNLRSFLHGNRALVIRPFSFFFFSSPWWSVYRSALHSDRGPQDFSDPLFFVGELSVLFFPSLSSLRSLSLFLRFSRVQVIMTAERPASSFAGEETMNTPLILFPRLSPSQVHAVACYFLLTSVRRERRQPSCSFLSFFFSFFPPRNFAPVPTCSFSFFSLENIYLFLSKGVFSLFSPFFFPSEVGTGTFGCASFRSTRDEVADLRRTPLPSFPFLFTGKHEKKQSPSLFFFFQGRFF